MREGETFIDDLGGNNDGRNHAAVKDRNLNTFHMITGTLRYAHGPQFASSASRSRMPTVPSPSKLGGPLGSVTLPHNPYSLSLFRQLC